MRRTFAERLDGTAVEVGRSESERGEAIWKFLIRPDNVVRMLAAENTNGGGDDFFAAPSVIGTIHRDWKPPLSMVLH